MGRADGLLSPQDPRRLPRLPRRHPLQRKRFTADPMSTGEPDATENGHVRFGKGSSEKELQPGATSPATYFTARPVVCPAGDYVEDPVDGPEVPRCHAVSAATRST